MTDLCANCGNPALFVYAAQGTRNVSYCNDCLPSFLRPLANKGLLAKTTSFDALQAQTQEAMLPAVEEEEEEVVVEAPAVSKKRRKAAAVVETAAADEIEEAVEDVVVEELVEEVVEDSVEEPVEAE